MPPTGVKPLVLLVSKKHAESAVRTDGGYPPHSKLLLLQDLKSIFSKTMTTKIRNWAVLVAAKEAQGSTNIEMYRRAKGLAGGQSDPMPTSHPAAPLSISAA